MSSSDAEKLASGYLKRIHVNRHIVAYNKKHGTDSPPITVQFSGGRIRGFKVDISGPSELIYRPAKPLSCGATVWIETTAALKVE